MLKPMIDLPFQPITWGGSPHDFTEQTAGGIHNLNLGLYTKEDIQRYIIGTRSMTWDGRVFRYAKCGSVDGVGIAYNQCGVKNLTILVANRIAGTQLFAVTVPTVAVGESEVTVTFTAGGIGNSTAQNDIQRIGVVAKNELCGGYISFAIGAYPSVIQTRGIIGNSAVTALDESMIIYLDAPLNYELSAATCEILANPYGNVAFNADPNNSVVGMPNVTADVDEYLWLQTWGPLRISPTGALGGAASSEDRGFMFDAQGAVVVADGSSQQQAGFLIERTTLVDNSAAPFIMLQICP